MQSSCNKGQVLSCVRPTITWGLDVIRPHHRCVVCAGLCHPSLTALGGGCYAILQRLTTYVLRTSCPRRHRQWRGVPMLSLDPHLPALMPAFGGRRGQMTGCIGHHPKRRPVSTGGTNLTRWVGIVYTTHSMPTTPRPFYVILPCLLSRPHLSWQAGLTSTAPLTRGGQQQTTEAAGVSASGRLFPAKQLSLFMPFLPPRSFLCVSLFVRPTNREPACQHAGRGMAFSVDRGPGRG